MASPFTVLYLRPEIASGFYCFPPVASTPLADNEAAATGDPEAPGAGGDASRTPTPSLFPGVLADEAACFLPDGQIVAAVRRRLQHSGFTVVQERLVQLTKAQLRRLYFSGLRAEDDERTRTKFLDGFTRGPTLVLWLSLHETNADPDAAVTTLQALVGPEENPSLARQQALDAGLPVEAWPLRALCGLNADFPGVYASATLDCAMRERHELFQPQPSRLESAVVTLFPPLLSAIPDAKAQLLAAFHRHGLVVTTISERASLSVEETVAIASAELHPTATEAAGRATFGSRLQGCVTPGSTTLVLRVVGFHLDATLRQLVGPASSAHAQRFFPESLRALLSAPLVTVDETVKSRENGATCLETGVFVSRHAQVVETLAPEDEAITQTFAIIKPNAARDAATVQAICHAIRAWGFTIDKHTRVRLSPAQAGAFYAEHTGKPFFARLTAFMTSGEIVALQLARKLAIPTWRALMGPTNCLVARATHPWTLRARFGLDGTENATHGSDAPASARRELRFFFGETPWNAPLAAETVAAVAKGAQRPLLPRATQDTLEQVLVRGLDALLAMQQSQGHDQWRGGALEACRWLGEWLLRQSGPPPADAAADDAPVVTSSRRGKATVAATPTSKPSDACEDLDDTPRIVAIVLDASVAAATKASVKQVVRDRVEPLGYAFVDVPAVAKSSLAAHVASVGRRRVVLFDWQPEEEVPPQHAVVRPSAVALLTTSATTGTSRDDGLVARATFEIPAIVRDASPLHALFRSVLDPLVVAFDGSTATGEWQRVAAHWGAVWLTWDTLVAREIARERDPLGAFTQWHRTRALLAPSLVYDALRRAVADPASVGFAPAAHKFVLVGFPWRSLDARALERSVGRVACVVRCGNGSGSGSGSGDGSEDDWGRVFEARGTVVRCEDPVAVGDALARVLAPHITLVLGTATAASANALDAVRHTATQLGDVWIDAATVTDTKLLRRVLLLRGAPRRVVLCGFPRTPEQADALLRDVAMPRAVLVVGGHVTAELEPVLALLQRAAPHAIQSVVAAATPGPRLRRLLLATRVAVVVGDSAALDAVALRQQLAVFGAALVDLRDQQSPSQDAPDVALDALAGVMAPRCLLLLRGATPVAYVRALQTRLGDALAQLVVLKQRTAQPPPPQRRRPGRDDGEDGDDAYDSEEERERERTRQREAAALAPPLAALVETLNTPPHAIRVRVESFLRVPAAHVALVAALRPAVVAVRGHALTFYREAARAVCRSLQVPFVDVHGTPSAAMSARLGGVVAACASPVVVVDGFPLGDGAADAPPAPSAAQQLRALERVATTPLLVRFGASLDVLLEKLAPTLGRNALEDAQDDMDSASARAVDACFSLTACKPAPHRRVLRDVSCEREQQDAQDAFADVLLSTGLVGTVGSL